MHKRADLDWAELGFDYTPTPLRFQAEWSGGTFDTDELVWKGGEWSEGGLIEDRKFHIEEGACSVHYAQQCFEGLKAFSGPDDAIRIFRPDENASRLQRSAVRLLMPEVPDELFLRAVDACVEANRAYLPPFGFGASMYIRPVLLGVGPNLGLKPAKRYIFRVFCSPVGPYFKGGFTSVKLKTVDWDRAAPRGTGAFKVGGNYAGGLLATYTVRSQGYNEALYLDAVERRWLEEAGSANVFGILPAESPGGALRFVTPKSDSILPSITMKSVFELAGDELGLVTERRRVGVDEIPGFLEMGCTGTAAVITPVGLVHHDGKDIRIESPGRVTKDLYELLRGIQTGRIEDARGWVRVIP